MTLAPHVEQMNIKVFFPTFFVSIQILRAALAQTPDTPQNETEHRAPMGVYQRTTVTRDKETIASFGGAPVGVYRRQQQQQSPPRGSPRLSPRWRSLPRRPRRFPGRRRGRDECFVAASSEWLDFGFRFGLRALWRALLMTERYS